MKISACLMVKDEEKLLPQCLESINQFVDEIVVVDTGSTDATVAIAELFGAKVYHSPWQGDFSFHRNEAFKYATGDWWLVIDADEKLVTVPNLTKRILHDWLAELSTEFNAVAVHVIDKQGGKIAMNCNSARLFRANQVHYERRIHNQPIFIGACVLAPLLGLEHYGYDLSPDKMKQKFTRTKNLLFQEMKDNPTDYDIYFYLSQLYGHHGHPEKCRYWAQKYLATKDKMPPDKFNRTIYFTLIKSCQEAKLLGESQKWLSEALQDNGHDPDLALALSDQGAMTGDHGMMADGARRYLRGYSELMENPAKKGGQFYFSLHDGSVNLCLYRLCVSSLEEGMKAWEYLKPRLKNVDRGLLDELKTNLNIIGCPHLIQTAPELSDVSGIKLLDIKQVAV